MVNAIARLMWVLPLILVVITLSLVRAGLNQRATLESGELVSARVVGKVIRNRADITYGHIDLMVAVPDSDSLAVRLPLPLSLLMSIQDLEEVDVRLVSDAAQPVMIERIAHAQWRMSLIQAAMSFMLALLVGWGVFAWNRLLSREGDPGSR